MNILDIEKRRGEVLQDLVYCTTPRQKLFIIKDFFALLLEQNNPALFEAYSVEFIEIYLAALSSWSPMYMHPYVTEELLAQIDQLLEINYLSSYHNDLKNCSNAIGEKLSTMKKYLSGTPGNSESIKLCFPVLEIQNYTHTKFKAGLLETVTIKITKGKGQDKFLIVPLTGNPEERLSEQITVSWSLALQYVKEHIRKVDKYHEVMIHFDGRLGNYIGYSLGLTLTIGFIEELLNYYNAPYLVNIKENIALTGGTGSDGDVLPVGNLIGDKVETVFYSGITTLIFPKDDEQSAEQRLTELQKNYTSRNLRLVPISSLQDLLDRRNLINIHRQNPVKRAYKSVRKNYIINILILFVVLLSYNFLKGDLDTNPARITIDGQSVLVKNTNGKILWSKELDNPPGDASHKYYARLADVNNDGTNEILLATAKTIRTDEQRSISCWDNSGKELWTYVFKDTISSPREILEPVYHSFLLDIDSVNNVLYSFALNNASYSSAVFKLDMLTGKRLKGTYWNCGHLNGGFLKDIDNDGETELICCAANNGYENVMIFCLPCSNISGTCPTIKGYGFYNLPPADFKAYISIRNNDYTRWLNVRFPFINFGDFFARESIQRIYLSMDCGDHKSGFRYEFHYDFRNLDIIISDGFRLMRDSLVTKNVLPQPFTDTKEYRSILKSEISFWNGKEFSEKPVEHL